MKIKIKSKNFLLKTDDAKLALDVLQKMQKNKNGVSYTYTIADTAPFLTNSTLKDLFISTDTTEQKEATKDAKKYKPRKRQKRNNGYSTGPKSKTFWTEEEDKFLLENLDKSNSWLTDPASPLRQRHTEAAICTRHSAYIHKDWNKIGKYGRKLYYKYAKNNK